MRDQLFAAVRVRLDRIAAARNPELALESGALDDAQRLDETLRDDDGDLEALYVLGWFHWYRCLALPQSQKYQSLEKAIQALTPCFIAGVERPPERLVPLLAENAARTAVTLLKQAMSTSDLTLIETTVSLWQRVLNATPSDHPTRRDMLSNLGGALHARFKRVDALADLDEAITVLGQAVRATPADHPDRSALLSNLGLMLWDRFGRLGAPGDLDEAINVGWRAVQASPADHPDLPTYLSNLGLALRARFERAGAPADLDETINVSWRAVQDTPADHPDRARHLSNLGIALAARFRPLGALADLDEAITVLRQAVQASPADHPDRATYLSNLSGALRAWFGRVGALADLDEAINVGRRAVQASPADHPDRAGRLSNLGLALRTGASGRVHRPIWMRRSAWVGERWRLPRPITPTGQPCCPTWASRFTSGSSG